jgi:gliding motility-associated-like protein
MKKITLIFMLFISFAGFAQLPLEGFEGTWTPLTGTAGAAGPSGWYIKNVAGPAQTWNQANNGSATPVIYGTKAAYLNRETVAAATVTEDWLITPQFTVPNNAQLKFWSRLTLNNDQGSDYKVMIGTDPTDASTFTDLQTWTELTLNGVQLEYEEKIVNIPAANAGQPRYIAFIMTGNNGDRWLIDEVQVVEQCFAPTALTANPSGTSAVLGWTSAATNFEVEVVPFATNFTNVGVANTGTTYTTPATLTPSTVYKYQVRTVCAPGNYSPWAGPFTFNTSQIAGSLNFSDGFEGTLDWSFVNGTQVNQWVYGTATANGGTHSLYISNDGTNNTYTVSPTQSVVSTYRDIQMPTAVDQLTLSFDWKGQGESTFDYLRVWLVPVSYTPVAGTQTTVANSGGIQIGGNFNLNGNWQTNTSTINAAAYAGTVRRLIFEWRNDTSVGTQPPAAIDNINLSLITCPAPTNLAISNVTQNSATFNWTGPTSVSPTFDFYFSTNATAPTASTTPTSNVALPTVTLPGLTPVTTYYYWVRSNCGTGDTSLWVGPIAFTTTQVPATLNYAQDFEGVHNFGFDNGTQPNKWIVGTATSNGGTHSLYITNDNGTSNAFTINSQSTVHAYRDIMIPAGTAEVDLTFDWKAVGESCCDFLKVWMVPASYTPVAGTLITTGNSGGLQVGANFNVTSAWTTYTSTINVSGYAGQVRRLVFEWRNDGSIGTQPPAAVDNVNMTIVTCPKPNALAATVTSTSANLSWTPQGTEGSWEVYVVPTGSAAPNAATIGVPATVATGTPYSPLTPNTTYQYYVRAICSTTDKSTWAGPFSFTTSIINDNFDGAITLSVNSGADCTLTTTTAFTAATTSALSLPTCSPYTTNGPDIWYAFTATNSTQTIALSTFSGTVQPVVISVYEGIPANGGELFCSANNAVNMVGLTPGTTYLVRLTLNPTTTTINLTTAFNICVSTPSNNIETNCEITTINPSFEFPDMAHTNSGQGPGFFNDNVVQGWRTGANDHVMEYWIEPNYEHQPAYHTNTGTDLFVTWPAFPAANSDQFIELNANANQGTTMGVYQDYAAAPGTVFVAKFAHRARNTNYASASYAQSGNVIDVMRLMAGPVPAPGQTMADVIGSYTQVGTNFSTSANGVPSGYPGTSGASIANGGNGTAWAYYGADGSLTYSVPAGQANTRFFFQAISTATPDTSVGNFLDAITFTANNAITSTNPATADCDPATTTIFNYVDVTATGGGTWIAHADNPSATIIADENSNSTTISGFTVSGTYQYEWTTAYCTNVLTVTYNAADIATPTAQETYTYCQADTATTLTATALAGYTLNWYTAPAGGTATTTAPTPDTSVAGTTTYYVSQSSTAGACESPRLAITVTVNEVPVAPVVADVTYCQTAVATALTATTSDATNTLNWYTVPTGGTAFAAAPTPYTSVAGTTPYYVSQSTAAGCESPRATINVTVTAPTTQVTAFTVPATVCIAGTNPTATLGGTTVTGGTFTSSDPALVIDGTTGVIDLALSTAGTYQVTYTVAGNVATCVALSSSTQPITVTPLTTPVSGFTYPALCISAANQLPTLSAGFSTGGTFTSSDAGLVIDPATGEINMSVSAAGNYVVTVSFPLDAVNCYAAATNTAPVTITPLATPVTGFSYAATCGLATTLSPVFATGFATAGTFTADAAVSINATTGVIDVANTAPGTYNVTYTLAQNDTTCTAGATVTMPVTITLPATPVVSFTYTNVCASAANQLPVLTAGFQAGGTFTAPAGLSINSTTGEITTANSTPGTYLVTYTFAADAVNCIAANTGTFSITITPVVTPVTGFDYDAAYCFGTTSVTPDLAANFYVGGTFSVTGGLTINPSTGEITNLAAAAPGTYTVTYAVAANPATCTVANSDEDTFTINTEILFTIDGECTGSAFVLTATPTDASFDPALVAYQWSTASGTPVGTDSPEFNVTEYVNSTTAVETFPMDFVLTVTSNDCDEPLTFTVEDISCEIQRGISPGGDDLNNYFDLASLGVKKLTIFNRYGEEVYAKNNYTVEWVGQTDNGQELPTGTYFYVIDRNVGETKTGWIYINRQN